MHMYAHPFFFGLEFVAEDRQLQRVNTRLFQWGRRLLMWPSGAPTAAVQGQLGWVDALGVSHPETWSVGRGASQSQVRRWLRHVRTVLISHANAWYPASVRGIEALHDYAQWQPHPTAPSGLWPARVSCTCSLLGGSSLWASPLL